MIIICISDDSLLSSIGENISAYTKTYQQFRKICDFKQLICAYTLKQTNAKIKDLELAI